MLAVPRTFHISPQMFYLALTAPRSKSLWNLFLILQLGYDDKSRWTGTAHHGILAYHLYEWVLR